LIERNARILARSPVFLENGVRLDTVAALLAHALEAASGRQHFQSLTLSASCFLVLCKANGAALDERRPLPISNDLFAALLASRSR
jgi:hypothetical protein